MAVPANRIGHAVYSAAELKTMQEVITLVVFAVLLGGLSEGAADVAARRRLHADRRRRRLRVLGAAGGDAAEAGALGDLVVMLA